MHALTTAMTKSMLDWMLLGANPVRPAGCFCGLSLTAPAAEEQRIKALDPQVSPDPKRALEAMEHAAVSRDRLQTLLPRLQRRLANVTRH